MDKILHQMDEALQKLGQTAYQLVVPGVEVAHPRLQPRPEEPNAGLPSRLGGRMRGRADCRHAEQRPVEAQKLLQSGRLPQEEVWP